MSHNNRAGASKIAFRINWENATIEEVQNVDVFARDGDRLTPLHFAARYNLNLEVFALLVDNGADIEAKDVNSRTPLHHAARHNENTEVLAFLNG